MPLKRGIVIATASCASVQQAIIRLSTITGEHHEERIQRFDLPEAQRFARAFCRHCGTPVPHQSRDGNGFIVPAGSLDQAPDRQPDDHIHFDSRAPWYDSTLQAPRFSAAPGSPPPIDPA